MAGKNKRNIKYDETISFRKPHPTMFKLLRQKVFKTSLIDMEQSFHCGGGAGRKTDYTNDDILFSIAIGFKFYTPEMMF